MSIITGEKFQLTCDHFLGTLQHLNYNPLLKTHSSKWLDIDKLTNKFSNKKIVFCYTDLTNRLGDILIDKLRLFENPFILVFHNSDDSFTINWLNNALKIPNLIKIYTENMNVIHDKVIPIPIGLANSMWPHGNSQVWEKLLNPTQTKDKFIYFYFSINTNSIKRQKCYDKIIKKGLQFSNSCSPHEYPSELIRYQYAICPDGNGLDTHRLWECLYLKVVPICTRSIHTEYFSKYFPIIILDDWDDLEINHLKENYNPDWKNYHKLSFNHYYNIMMSDIMASFSQCNSKGQKLDYLLHYLFNKRNGFFIELGANDGLTQSNTAMFEKYLGWSGLLIEPSEIAYKKCVINRPNSICVNYACVSNDFKEDFILGDFNGHCMSSVDGCRLNNKDLVSVKAITLEKLLDTYGNNCEIDFLSLDTEGYELDILKGLNLFKFRPKYILIEIYKKDYDAILRFLTKYSYNLHSNMTDYNKNDNPMWDGTHNDYLFVDAHTL